MHVNYSLSFYLGLLYYQEIFLSITIGLIKIFSFIIILLFNHILKKLIFSLFLLRSVLTIYAFARLVQCRQKFLVITQFSLSIFYFSVNFFCAVFNLEVSPPISLLSLLFYFPIYHLLNFRHQKSTYYFDRCLKNNF